MPDHVATSLETPTDISASNAARVADVLNAILADNFGICPARTSATTT